MVIPLGRLGAGGVRPVTLRLIVNADDYGITAATNRGIERAHLDGVVTSTTVMANQLATAEAIDLRTRCPDLGVGIHLTLTLGAPLAPVDRVRSLLGPEGRLLERPHLPGQLRDGGVVASEVVSECVAQVRALRVIGVEPDHWDVHQHLHEYPASESRSPRQCSQRGCCAPGIRGAPRDPCSAETQGDHPGPAASSDGRARPAQLHDSRLTVRGFPARWGDLIRRSPGWGDRGNLPPRRTRRCLPASTIGSAERVAELDALCDGRLRERIAERGIQLTTFAMPSAQSR